MKNRAGVRGIFSSCYMRLFNYYLDPFFNRRDAEDAEKFGIYLNGAGGEGILERFLVALYSLFPIPYPLFMLSLRRISYTQPTQL
jgi:hypothetical protein